MNKSDIKREEKQGVLTSFKVYDFLGHNFWLGAPVLNADKTFLKIPSYRPVPDDILHETVILEIEFFKDIDFIISNLTNQNSFGDQELAIAFLAICRDHISDCGRLIDTDLATYVDLTVLTLQNLAIAIHATSPPIEVCKEYFIALHQHAQKNFNEFIYITKYKNENGYLVPYLEKL